jgi:hypothetical protein
MTAVIRPFSLLKSRFIVLAEPVHTNKKARQVIGGRRVHFKKSLNSRRSPEVPMIKVMGGIHEEPV